MKRKCACSGVLNVDHKLQHVDISRERRAKTQASSLSAFVIMQCPAGSFVHLSPDRRRFELDGAPFFFTGCNSYYLMTRAADPGLQQQVLEVLDDAKAAGLTVVRTWAFNDGPEWNALQPSPGERSLGLPSPITLRQSINLRCMRFTTRSACTTQASSTRGSFAAWILY